MKKTKSQKTTRKNIAHSQKKSAEATSELRKAEPVKVANKQMWKKAISDVVLPEYAIPFIRMIEAKLISLQHRI